MRELLRAAAIWLAAAIPLAPASAQRIDYGPASQAALSVTSSTSSGIMADSFTPVLPGTGYVPGDSVTLTCSGCTATTSAVANVADTKAVSATVQTAGASGSNGACTITGTTGTGTKAQFTGTVSGGALTGPLTVAVAGDYTVNPTDITQEPVTGCSLVGAKVAMVTGILAAQIRNPGRITVTPGNSPTFTQSATSGSGTGATFTGNFGPIAADLSANSLSTGGAITNGSLFIGAEQPLATLKGAENTFLGDRAGGNFTGVSAANSAFGHNACGIGGNGSGTTVGSFNTCLGDDAGRNIFKAGGAPVNSVTAVGQNSFRAVGAGFNTGLGAGTGQAVTSGGFNTFLGYLTGATNCQTGADNLLIDTGNNTVDCAATNSTHQVNFAHVIAGDTVAATNPSICAVGVLCVLGVLRSADFNVTTDQSIVIRALTTANTGRLTSVTKYIITEINVANCSASLTTAKGGVYTAASKGGTIIGATTTAYTGCTGATTRQRNTALTNMDNNTFTAATLFLALTTAQGGAATGDVYIMGYPIN